MTKLMILLAVLFQSLASQASLLEATIAQGPHQGESLLSVVSQTLPARAVHDAFTFFDTNQGVKRSALVYSTAPNAAKPPVTTYVCDKAGIVCKKEIVQQTLFANSRYLIIFDLNQSSMTPRFHIVDLTTGEVTSLFASHGKESTCPNDMTRACKFISDRDSGATPLGFFLTGHTFFGQDKWEIPLIGLQGPAVGAERNDVPSTIVIHGAPYASAAFRQLHGYMGRSLGCPALSFDDILAWKDRLQDGALFYFFHDSLPAQLAPVSNVVEPGAKAPGSN